MFGTLLDRTKQRRELHTPLNYRTFLVALRGTMVDQRDLSEAIENSTLPSAMDVVRNLTQEMERDPYGMMNRARRLKSVMIRTGNNPNIGANEGRRRCLGELIQQTRTKAGMARDNSNNKASYEKLWMTFLKAKKRTIAKTHSYLTPKELNARVEKLKAKSTRGIRKAKTKRLLGQRIPTWSTATYNPVADVWLNRKLCRWAGKAKRRIMGNPLRRAKVVIKENYRMKVTQAGNEDSRTITAATWNVDKNISNVPKVVATQSLIPDNIDVLFVTEASMGRKRSRPSRMIGWNSSSIRNCQIIARDPIKLTEIEFPQPPKRDDGVHDSTEFLACATKIRGVDVTCIAGYFPPEVDNERITAVFNTFVRECVALLHKGPVLIGADVNFHLGDRHLNPHLATATRQKTWNKVWEKAQKESGASLTLISRTDTPTFHPSGDAMPSVLDAVYFLAPKNYTFVAYPTLSAVRPLHTQHSLVTGSIGELTQMVPPPQNSNDEERIKWEEIRYDKEKQGVFRRAVETELLSLVEKGTFEVSTISETIVKTGKSVLGLINAGSDTNSVKPKRTTRLGTARRRKEPWWNKDLDDKAKEITKLRRRVETATKKAKRRGRSQSGRDGQSESANERERKREREIERERERIRFQLTVAELKMLRRDLSTSIDRLAKLRDNTRRQHFDEIASNMSLKDPSHLTKAHKIRKKVLEIRSGKTNTCSHSAKTMNEAWTKIFKGAQGVPPNLEFLDGTLATIRQLSADGEDIVIDEEHILKASKLLKLGKAPGLDGVTNEALRLIRDPKLLNAFAALYSDILNNPLQMDAMWKKGLVALLPKKEDPTPLDYRPIALLSHHAKFMELVIKVYMEDTLRIESKLGVYQGGFRKGRGTEESSLTLMAIDEICRQQKKPLIAVFLDIKKAYDSVPAKVLAASLARKNIPPRLVIFLFEWVTGHKRKLLIPGNDDEDAWLDLEVGVPQGSILAPFLFACVMDTLDGYLKGEAVLGLPAPLFPSPGLNIQPMINKWREIMYADDTAIFSHCIDNCNATLRKVAAWSNYSRMEFHPSKFECLRSGLPDSKNSNRFAPKTMAAPTALGNRGNLRSQLKYKRAPIPVVEKAKHLGLFKSAIPSNQPPFAIDLTKRLKKVANNTSALAFAYKVKKNAATAHFASNLHRSVAEGGAYFGCSLCDYSKSQVQKIKGVIGNAAKAGLGVHRTASTTCALAYLGWQKPEVVIAMRRLSLLVRVMNKAPAEVKALVKQMVTNADESFPCHYLQLLNKSVDEVVHAETKEEHWPKDAVEWTQLMDKDAESIREWYGNLCDGIVYNCQHPLIRAAPHLAGIAFRFICPSLKPFERKDNVGACQLCNCIGGNTGFHLLTGCQEVKTKAITSTLLSNYQAAMWSNARQSNDFSGLNELIEMADPTLKDQPTKIRDLVLIKDGGNDLDILARILRGHLQDADETKKLIERGKMVWQDMSVRGQTSAYTDYKSELYTAYNWIGNICADLWEVYCSREGLHPQQRDDEHEGDDEDAMQ